MVSRQKLLDGVLASITAQEWAALENNPQDMPVNEFNRTTLLRLRALGPLDGEVPAERAASLRSQLEQYLAEQLADNPDAHRFIVASCVALTFLLREPMHPVERTGIRVEVRDGEKVYYCPLKESQAGTLCDMCVSQPMSATNECMQVKS